ncbi:MAG: DUF2490 domain-containing protein [Chitinophagaceae bacterium]|nr:DUF2490 domain-containing protein [Chitinophagaceae bacterium]
MKLKILITCAMAACTFITAHTNAQNTRISDHNKIGWYTYTGTFKLNNKFGIHTEYQFRRDNFITDWQQSLLRLGINYQANSKLQLRLGYARIETYPYGDIPINSYGKNFKENRMFEMATVSDKIGIVEMSHRFMLEQRWIGKYSSADKTKEDLTVYTNRFRYMNRMQVPLKGKTIGNKTPYAAIYDEILIGFGKNAGENVFDQNRFGLLLGYKLNQHFKIEGGFFSQIVELGRKVNNRDVFQYNNGIILNTVFNFDVSKKKS